ncbi:phosphate signaling complex protein PhoU [Saccharibacter sp. 17.LH.SD]|uniref:phosphate signaling complex protein PhoU n=1 Tax=Saccharibacter sp. 17.LH.SD TaxID=2689393 RepID=UPI00136D117C|nr:phosphate signaling complex protein PhoU [Saccharibacter sp. 17.LH.SD]
MPEHSHIVKRYEQELAQLRSLMAQMGGMVEQQLSWALSAIADGHEDAARLAVKQEADVDLLEYRIEALAIRLLALRSPMADDLREIVSAMKIAGDLERIGDYAASMAVRVLQGRIAGLGAILVSFRQMGHLVQDNLRRSLDAVLQKNKHASLNVWHADLPVDDYYTAIFRGLLANMMQDPRHIYSGTELLFIVKNLERIGDHATNIAERAFFVVTGDVLPSRRPRGGALKEEKGAGT